MFSDLAIGHTVADAVQDLLFAPGEGLHEGRIMSITAVHAGIIPDNRIIPSPIPPGGVGDDRRALGYGCYRFAKDRVVPVGMKDHFSHQANLE